MNSIDGIEMQGYYTVKLQSAQGLPPPVRIRLETSYAAYLEAEAGGCERLLELCITARQELAGGTARETLRLISERAEARAMSCIEQFPPGARFALSLWQVEDL